LNIINAALGEYSARLRFAGQAARDVVSAARSRAKVRAALTGTRCAKGTTSPNNLNGIWGSSSDVYAVGVGDALGR